MARLLGRAGTHAAAAGAAGAEGRARLARTGVAGAGAVGADAGGALWWLVGATFGRRGARRAGWWWR